MEKIKNTIATIAGIEHSDEWGIYIVGIITGFLLAAIIIVFSVFPLAMIAPKDSSVTDAEVAVEAAKVFDEDIADIIVQNYTGDQWLVIVDGKKYAWDCESTIVTHNQYQKYKLIHCIDLLPREIK